MNCEKMGSIDEGTTLSNEHLKPEIDDMQLASENGRGRSYTEVKETQKNATPQCYETEIDHSMSGIDSVENSNEKKEQGETEKDRRHLNSCLYEQHSEIRRSENDSNTSDGVIEKENEVNRDLQKPLEMCKTDHSNAYDNLNNTSNLKKEHIESKRNDTSHSPVNSYGNEGGISIDAPEKTCYSNSVSKKNMSRKKNKMEVSSSVNFVNPDTGSSVSNTYNKMGHKQEVHNFNNGAIINNLNGQGFKLSMPVNSNTGISGGCEITSSASNEMSMDQVSNIPMYNSSNSNYNYAHGYGYNINSNANYSNNSYSNTNTYINNTGSNNTNGHNNNTSGSTNANNNSISNNGSGNSITSYNNTTNYYPYACCTEEHDKNCECQSYYPTPKYNTCYTDCMPGGTVVVAATTSTTSTAAAAASTVSCTAGGQYDYRYAYVMNDYCNYHPYNGNYYYYNANGSYYNMNVNCGNMSSTNANNISVANSSLPYVDPIKSKKENNLIADKTSSIAEVTDSSNIYDELKSKVVDIFKRENMMTDEYLLYYVYNNVKLNLNIIAKHPHICSIIGNNVNVLQDVLNDLKQYDMVTTESEESTNRQLTDNTSEIMEGGTGKQQRGNDTSSDKSCNFFIEGEEKVDMKKNERKKEVSVAVNEKREDSNIISSEICQVENDLLKGMDVDSGRRKIADGAEEVVKYMKQETDGTAERKKYSDNMDIQISSVNKKEKSEDKECSKEPEEVSPKSDALTTEEDNKDFLLNLNNKRNTIIIRDIYAYFIDKIKELVFNCPHIDEGEIMDIKNECNNTIFITLKNAKKTEALAQYLKEQTVDNAKLNVRIKSIQKIQNIIENNIIKKAVSVNSFGNAPNTSVANSRTFNNVACGESVLEGCSSFSTGHKARTNKASSGVFLIENNEVATTGMSNETSGFVVENSSNCATDRNNESTGNNAAVVSTTVNNNNANDSTGGNEQETGNNANVDFLKVRRENVAYGGTPNVNPVNITGMRTINEMKNYYIMPNNMVIAYDSNMCPNNNISSSNVTGAGFDPMLNYYHYVYGNPTYGCGMYSPINSCDACNSSVYNTNNMNNVLSANFSTNGDMTKGKGDFEKGGSNYVRGDEMKMLNNENMNVKNFYMDTYNATTTNNNGYANNYGNLYAMNYVNTSMYPYNFAQTYYQYNVHNMYGNNFKGVYNGIYNGGYNGTYNSQISNINNNTNSNIATNKNGSSNNSISTNINMSCGDNKEVIKFESFSDETKNLCATLPAEKLTHNGTHLRKSGKRETKGATSNGTNVIVMSPNGSGGMAAGNQNNTTTTGSTTSNSASRFSQRNGKTMIINTNNVNGGFTKGGKVKYNKKEVGNYDNFLSRNNVNGYDSKWNNSFPNRRGGRFDYERKVDCNENVDGASDVNGTDNANNENGVIKDGFNFDNPEVARMRRENNKKLAADELNTAEVESARGNNEGGEENNCENGKQPGKVSCRREYEHEKDNEKRRIFKGDKIKNRKEIYSSSNGSNNNNNNNSNNNNTATSSNNNNNRRSDYGFYYSYHNDKKDFFKNMSAYSNGGAYNSNNGNSFSASSNNNNVASRRPFKFYQNKDKYNSFYEDRKGYRGRNNFDSHTGNNSNDTGNNFSNKEESVTVDGEKNDVARNEVTNNINGGSDLNKDDTACTVYASANINSNVHSKKVNDNSKNFKKYSFVDIVDSCKKIKEVKPPECIDNLMKENVSLFRKRNDQFCWKLNVC